MGALNGTISTLSFLRHFSSRVRKQGYMWSRAEQTQITWVNVESQRGRIKRNSVLLSSNLFDLATVLFISLHFHFALFRFRESTVTREYDIHEKVLPFLSNKSRKQEKE